MHGCGLRIGEALAVSLRCRINRGKTLRVREQVNPAAQLRPLKFRKAGEFRDIPLPEYVSEAIDKHVAEHGTTPDGYLFQGRKYKLVVRRSYQEDFQRAAARAGLPPEFIPHSLRHLYASTALAEGIPITEVSRWLGHNSIEVSHGAASRGTARAPAA
jgi:integrase